MIKTKNKLITILILLFLLLLLSGFQAFKSDKGVVSQNIDTVEGLKSAVIGGVASKMPDNSAKILFESILGQKLNAYHSYNNIAETLAALRCDEIQAAWFSDVSAQYLLRAYDGFREIATPDPLTDRMEFGMIVKNDSEGEDLLEDLNTAISILEEEGTLDKLLETYVFQEIQGEPFKASDMIVNKPAYEEKLTGEPLYIGITGAVPPLELLDLSQEPYGFCAAFMDKIGQFLGRRVEFVVLGNETSFSALMGGRIHAVFCYGSSPVTVEGSLDYIATNGYCKMKKYAFLALE